MYVLYVCTVCIYILYIVPRTNVNYSVGDQPNVYLTLVGSTRGDEIGREMSMSIWRISLIAMGPTASCSVAGSVSTGRIPLPNLSSCVPCSTLMLLLMPTAAPTRPPSVLSWPAVAQRQPSSVPDLMSPRKLLNYGCRPN